MLNSTFDFSTSNRIIFGNGKLSVLGDIAGGYGSHAMVVTGEKHPDPKTLFTILRKSGIAVSAFSVPHEPDLPLLIDAVELGRKAKCDFVIGFGGGASIDTGKAVAALLKNDGDVLDYLEVVGKGIPLRNPSRPFIAIPTTAGTGSEVTRNAVISIPEKRVKVSMRNAFLLPSIALIDPELTLTVPPSVTASTGMDALTQVIEPYLSRFANPMVDIFCREAVPSAANSLYKAYLNGEDLDARTKMAFVSLLGGLSLANAKLGAVHGFAGPIGGMFDAPHGSICAALLPAVMLINAETADAQEESAGLKTRFVEIARWLTGEKTAAIADGVDWLANLAQEMGIPGLAAFGIEEKDFPAIIEKSKNSSSMKGNPVPLTGDQLHRILKMSL